MGTPHLLLNSGIGDKHELAALGIASTVHLPDVGRNLSDHVLIGNNWLVNGRGQTYDEINRNSSLTDELVRQWNISHQGPLVDTLASQLIFGRVPSNITRLYKDSAAGPNTPHYELMIAVSHSANRSLYILIVRRAEWLLWCHTRCGRIHRNHILDCESCIA